MNKLINFFLLSLFLFSCAEIVPPSGGQKDVTPPKVETSSPENFSTNFNSNKIELKFDEFIKLNTAGGNIIISPSLSKKPKFELIGRKVIITFQEKLLNKTTYIINFGSSIKDNNEGNELQNYKYIFSTGEFIDSLKIEGKIINALNKEGVKDIIVGLYPKNEDSILYKKPTYFTKTDEAGNYFLENLKSNTYQIAALEDKNLNLIYDQESERICFYDKKISLTDNINKTNLFLFRNLEKTRITSTDNKTPNYLKIGFNRSFKELDINIENNSEDDIMYYGINNQTIHYWYNDKPSKKTGFKISNNDYLIDSFKLDLKNLTNKDPFNLSINTTQTESSLKLLLDFPYPVSSFNKEEISITSNNKTIAFESKFLNNNLNLEISTKSLHDSIIISIKKDCFKSFHNINSSAVIDTIYQFDVQLSNLIINIEKGENLIIELYNKGSDLIKKEIVSRETKVFFNNLKQGTYFIRIYEDNNKDYIWNSGNIKTRKQPERTVIYQKVELKNNWDKEIDININ